MDWITYFERNRAHRMSIPWEEGITVEGPLREPLIRSLQRFQVGEQGDGTHLKRGAEATGDPTYARAIELFIEEEQEHSRLLARLLGLMDAPLVRGHWSDACFRLVRHVAGLRLELLVLLTAELIAKRYYHALHKGTQDPVLQNAFAQILHDEIGHVAFHCDYLQRAFAPTPILARLLVAGAWQLFFRVVCLVVMFDHRHVLRAVGVSPSSFRQGAALIFEDAAARIFSPIPVMRKT